MLPKGGENFCQSRPRLLEALLWMLLPGGNSDLHGPDIPSLLLFSPHSQRKGKKICYTVETIMSLSYKFVRIASNTDYIHSSHLYYMSAVVKDVVFEHYDDMLQSSWPTHSSIEACNRHVSYTPPPKLSRRLSPIF